jgi:hypothetical protein
VLDFEMQHTGHGFVRAASELGAWIADGHAPSDKDRFQPHINHKAALAILSEEVVILAQESSRIRGGQVITDHDVERLLVAAGRIQGVCADLGFYKFKEKA